MTAASRGEPRDGRRPHAASAVPVFPVADVARALRQYRDIGFTARLHPTGSYGFLRLGAARIDVVDAAVADSAVADTSEAAGGPYRGRCSLTTDDPDGLAARMAEAGHGTVTGPVPTEWGRSEGTYTDADGNLIRFGCPLRGTY